jgi:hypothetical protein
MDAETSAFISAIAASATAIFSIWTIRSMNKQRKESLQPEICVLCNDLIFNRDPHGFPLEIFEDSRTPNIKPNLNLINIGKGSSKEIESIFFFNLDEALKHIQEESSLENRDNPSFSYKFSETRNAFEKSIVTMILDNKFEYDLNEYIPLFLKANVEQRRKVSALLMEQEKSFQIPYDYLILLSMFGYYKYKVMMKNGFRDHPPSFSNFPKLTYLIKYKNILGEQTTKKFELVLELTEWNNGNHENDHKLMGKGYFEVTETF